MKLHFGLKDDTISKIQTVFASYPQVEKVVLYGSRAKGNFKNGSDIDLTLCGGEDLTLRVLYRIMDEIDDLLLPYTFDLSIFAISKIRMYASISGAPGLHFTKRKKKP